MHFPGVEALDSPQASLAWPHGDPRFFPFAEPQ